MLSQVPSIPPNFVAGMYYSGADLDLIAANLYGVQRMSGETDEQVRDRCLAKLGYSLPPNQAYIARHTSPGDRVKQFKVRQKSTGLFWNGNRWAKLEGTYAEANAVSLDDEKELVELHSQVQQRSSTLMTHAQMADMYQMASQAAVQQPNPVYTAAGGYAGQTKGPPAVNHPAWPRQTHPNTGEPFVDGSIGLVTRGKISGMVVAGDCLYGQFTTATGSSAAGYLHGSPGGTWQWDKVVVKKNSCPF